MIGLVNYGSGNIQALSNIYHRLGIPFTTVSTPSELAAVDRIILPGVGAFDQAMRELNASGLRAALDREVRQKQKPCLGICVGMQLMAAQSEEGSTEGLAWIPGTVRKLGYRMSSHSLQLPHMGWNGVETSRPDPIFSGVDLSLGYYFLHSFCFVCQSEDDVLGTTSYGEQFPSVIKHEHIYGVQFHPEKSHQAGIALLKNFAQYSF